VARCSWIPTLTSPYEFYQYWLNDDDQLVVSHLRWLTLLDQERIAGIEAEQSARPEARVAQKALAHDLTARVHWAEEAERQRRVAEAAFSGEPIRDPDVLRGAVREPGAVRVRREELGEGALKLAVSSGTYTSNSEARRAITQGAFSINDTRVTDPAEAVAEPIAGEWLVVRHGRKKLPHRSTPERVAERSGGTRMPRAPAPRGAHFVTYHCAVHRPAYEAGSHRISAPADAATRQVTRPAAAHPLTAAPSISDRHRPSGAGATGHRPAAARLRDHLAPRSRVATPSAALASAGSRW
jgi:hypothetical protein